MESLNESIKKAADELRKLSPEEFQSDYIYLEDYDRLILVMVII